MTPQVPKNYIRLVFRLDISLEDLKRIRYMYLNLRKDTKFMFAQKLITYGIYNCIFTSYYNKKRTAL